MTGSSWLEAKHQSILPPDSELTSVRRALDEVEHRMTEAAGSFRIATRHPCGSFAKKTMLAGRKEADLVVVLSEAPTDRALDDLRDLLQGCAGAQRAVVKHRAVEVDFLDGVHVDVLPTAKHGVTAPGSSIPKKLRHALNGPVHVEWFRQFAHGTPILQTVRLLKAVRTNDAAWQPLSSFAVEVLAVDLLTGYRGDLRAYFVEALHRVANGELRNRSLADPANPNNNLLADLSQSDRSAIAGAAAIAQRSIALDNWSSVFGGDSAPPPPASNIGGRTLA
jgi:hypothetical protein